MKKHIMHIALLLAIACNVAAEGEKTKIGVILPLTGAFARYGERIQRAVSQFKDPAVEFVFEDEGCSPKIAVTSFNKLSQMNGIHYFLGPWCGSPQTALAPLIKVGNQFAMLGSSAPRAVFTLSDKRMFSTQTSIEAESTYLAQQVDRLGYKKLITVFKENNFSRAHEAAFQAAYKGEILHTFAYGEPSELKAIALQIKKQKADALYVPDAFPLLTGFTKELALLGIDIPIFSVYSVQSDDVLKAMGKAGKHLIYSYPDLDNIEALDHFPVIALKTLVEVVKKCKEDTNCAREEMLSRKDFDQYGVLNGKLILKTIKNGAFTSHN